MTMLNEANEIDDGMEEVTVVFRVPKGTSKKNMSILLLESLYEFRAHRSPSDPERYVRSRYSNTSFDEEWMKEKIIHVQGRLDLAQQMRNDFSIK